MKKKSGIQIAIWMIIALIFAVPANTSAQVRRHVVKKEVVVKHDKGYKEVVVKEKHYFYRDGYFYDMRHEGYVKIAAPIGARITILPRGYKIVRMHRVKYFLFGGIYYRYLPHERVYVVVKEPR